jgi:histidine triad (HIT) family protein
MSRIAANGRAVVCAPRPSRSQVIMSTIFSKILSGEIPSHKIYEDDHVFVFLDISPLSRGHTLVIPKEAKPSVDQLSDESAAAIGRVLPRICRAVMKVSGTPHYNILQNNGAPAHQAVFHVHFHIIPKPDEASGLGIKWPTGKLEDGENLAQAMRAALQAES